MSVNLNSLGDIKKEIDTVVGEAVHLADLVDKYAAVVAKFASVVPGVGAEVATVVKVIDELDKALHAAQAVLANI